MLNDTESALFQTALRYLGYRDRFRKEIELRLKKQIIAKKYNEKSLNLIPIILDKLESSGLINDQNLIDTYIKNQHDNNLRGPHVIKQRLLRMGAPTGPTNTSIEKYITKNSQNRAIDKLIKKRKLNLKDFKTQTKFKRYLVSRGFSIDRVNEKIANIQKKE